MTTDHRSRAPTIGLAIVIVADIALAVIYQQWWLVAVAAGLFAVLLSMRDER